MLDDLETNILQEDKVESTSDKFSLSHFNLPASQQNVNILSMSSSKKYIFLVTDRSELLLIESETLRPIQQAYTIEKPETYGKFYENITKIWTDRAGNHSIIRHNRGIYYFNSSGSYVKELQSLKGVEVCAVGFDDRNTDSKSTGNFLVTDFFNKIYECNILVESESNGDYYIKDTAEVLVTLSFKDPELEEDDDLNDPKNKNYDRIQGIKFFRATKANLNTNENACYIIAATRNRFYQFIGPGLTSFRQIFGRYARSPILFNESCKHFPSERRKGFNGKDLDIIFRTEQRGIGDKKSIKIDVFNQFGWKTESGYCYGNFNYNNSIKSTGLPYELKNFIVIPFAKITNEGEKIMGEEPKDVMHTNNHIFMLYKDCISIISKLTNNIIHTQYCQIEYDQLLYHEFSKDNGIILLTSHKGLYQISLKDENNDIWKDYLEIGDYQKAQNFCGSDKLKRKINRIDAEYELEEKKDGFNAANKFANSDEKFENVCLKYLMRNDVDGLNLYLQLYMESNLNKEDKNKKQPIPNDKKEDILQLSLICTWVLEIFLKQSGQNKTNMDEFRQNIRENRKYLDPGLIYELLQSYGKMEEFLEFASLMSDYEKSILYYINNGEIGTAIEQLTWFSSFATEDTPAGKKLLDQLTNIFSDNAIIFFKKHAKESISLLQQRLKNVKMEKIVQAIMSTTNKDLNENKSIIDEKEKKQKAENSQAILSYLKSLIGKTKIEEKNNIHNLYIYYLSRDKANQEAIIEYLKGFLKYEENQLNPKKKEIYFSLDYAQKLFKDNPPAYSLVLALMGKYTEGVRKALNQNTEECKKIAEYIASNAPGEKLKKKLWIDIFACDNQEDFNKALAILDKSKVLKIQDVLPHITDTIKIEDFKKQISNCINQYETNIKKLKKDINDYNKIAENIKSDISNVKKKSMELQFNNCKCEICQGYIKDKKIFLFPCGHKFDMNCIKECLLNYEATGLNSIHNKNVEIDDLFFQLGFSKDRAFDGFKKGEEETETKKKEEVEERGVSGIFSRLKEYTGFRKQEVQEIKETKQTQDLRNRLFKILSEECVLCGDFMIDSLQSSFSPKTEIETDKNGLKLKVFKEPEFNL